MINIDNILRRCSICQAIEVDSRDKFRWMKREECPQVYEQMLSWNKGRVSSGYCQPCQDKFMEENQ